MKRTSDLVGKELTRINPLSSRSSRVRRSTSSSSLVIEYNSPYSTSSILLSSFTNLIK
jgi:hypothetical protein